jgi:cysteine desulfuration protein SufE
MNFLQNDPIYFESCIIKQEELKKYFYHIAKVEDKYEKLIALGRQLFPLSDEHKVPENLVHGCQSQVYLRSYLKEGKVIFEAASEALISAGLAALLIAVYSGEEPGVILKCPPSYLETLGIHASLTPSRSNGLSSIYLRMKQEALKFLLCKTANISQ